MTTRLPKFFTDAVLASIDLSPTTYGGRDEDDRLYGKAFRFSLADEIRIRADAARPLVAVRRRRAAARIADEWAPMFDGLDLLLASAEAIGAATDRDFEPLLPDSEIQASVLLAMHTRGCRVAHEVTALLAAGFASGAFARSRTLHEITVVALFLTQHGPALCRRFADHEVIEAFNAAQEYQRSHKEFGGQPYSEKELEELGSRRDEVLSRYGTKFGRPNGWAVDILGEPATFAALEKAVQFSKHRSVYRAASHAVHANIKGLTYSIEHGERDAPTPIGPQQTGLAIPASEVARLLPWLTIPMIALNPGRESDEYVDALFDLGKDVERTAFSIARRRDRESR